jgi:hypothetical protein
VVEDLLTAVTFTFSETVASIQEYMEKLTQRDRDSVILHMVANSDNFREIKDVVALADRLGVKVVNVGNYICAQPEHLDKTLWNIKKGIQSGTVERAGNGRQAENRCLGQISWRKKKSKAPNAAWRRNPPASTK